MRFGENFRNSLRANVDAAHDAGLHNSKLLVYKLPKYEFYRLSDILKNPGIYPKGNYKLIESTYPGKHHLYLVCTQNTYMMSYLTYIRETQEERS